MVMTNNKEDLKLREEYIEQLLEYLTSQNVSDLVWIWNDYCEKAHYYDDCVYCDWEIDDLFYGKKPSEIIEMASEIDNVPEYFTISIYGTIEPWSEEDIEYEYRSMAEFFIDGERSEDNGINDIVDEYEERLGELEDLEE